MTIDYSHNQSLLLDERRKIRNAPLSRKGGEMRAVTRKRRKPVCVLSREEETRVA